MEEEGEGIKRGKGEVEVVVNQFTYHEYYDTCAMEVDK